MLTDRETKLDAVILAFGAATADLFEQAMKCNFVDDQGHKLTMNMAMIKLSAAMMLAMDTREELGCPKP